jgi:demethylmenaquinone methyltransferase / 2-methoxy-6-polyprenyl-1,4-benzoquinol methylase
VDVTAPRTEPNVFAQGLFSGLPARYNALAQLLSFGQDRHWHDEAIEHVVGDSPQRVLDVACGPAAVTCALAARTTGTVVGLDLTEDMLLGGAVNVARAGLSDRVGLVLGRGEQLPFADGAFDALTFTYLLRYVADPAATVAELARTVRAGGRIASVEFAVPPNPLWHASWWLYTRGVLPLAGLATGGRAWFDVGRFLGPSISAHDRAYPLPWILEAWEHAGIGSVSYRRMSLGGGLVIWGTRT